MSVSAHAIASRLSRELGDDAKLWLAPGLEAMRPALGAWLADRDATLAIVAATQLSERGEIRADTAPPEGARVFAVVMLDAEPRGAIVERIAGPAVARAERVFCDHGVLEVTPEGLVISELVAGVSARDLQGRVEAALLVGPHVKEMVVTPPRDGV